MATKKQARAQALVHEQAFGRPPYHLRVTEDYLQDLYRLPLPIAELADVVLQDFAALGHAGLFDGKPALKPLTSTLLGWWRLGLAEKDPPRDLTQYRILIRPLPTSYRGKQIVEVAAVLPRRNAYDAFASRLKLAK